jgi:hypothetical protein
MPLTSWLMARFRYLKAEAWLSLATRTLPTWRTALDVVLHQCAHKDFLSKSAPVQIFTGSIQGGITGLLLGTVKILGIAKQG